MNDAPHTQFQQQALHLAAAQQAPDWLSALRFAGAEQWLQAGWPGRRTELWKYTPLQALQKTPFQNASGALHSIPANTLLDVDATRLVFVNGILDAGASSLGQTGVVLFSAASPEQQALIAKQMAEIAVALLDTDARSLPVGTAATLQLGRAQTRGMGTGGESALGLASAESEEAALRRLFAGIPVVVLVTGLGGGTGSGAASVVAGFAAECGATVLSFATMPFSHEGERRMRQANDATVKLGQKCHGLVVVHNDLLLQQVSPDAPLSESFAAADNWVGDRKSVV